MGGLLTTAADLGQVCRVPPFGVAAARRPGNRAGPARLGARDGSPLDAREPHVRRERRRATASEAGYGFGLRIATDCRFDQIVSHGGGLPGFGSYMSWLPDYGVGMFAMANLTYVGPAAPISQAWDVLLKTGGLQKRELPASPVLSQMRDHIVNLWKSWNEAKPGRLRR